MSPASRQRQPPTVPQRIHPSTYRRVFYALSNSAYVLVGQQCWPALPAWVYLRTGGREAPTGAWADTGIAVLVFWSVSVRTDPWNSTGTVCTGTRSATTFWQPVIYRDRRSRSADRGLDRSPPSTLLRSRYRAIANRHTSRISRSRSSVLVHDSHLCFVRTSVSTF